MTQAQQEELVIRVGLCYGNARRLENDQRYSLEATNTGWLFSLVRIQALGTFFIFYFYKLILFYRASAGHFHK